VANGLAPWEPPRETAIGALGFYVSNANPQHYEPTNITFGIMPALTSRSGGPAPKNKGDRKLAYAGRALAALDDWVAGRSPSPARPDSVPASTR
jgi:methylenetetrahydrofolate--tRNA-(uracil-5-)-methyltransferase